MKVKYILGLLLIFVVIISGCTGQDIHVDEEHDDVGHIELEYHASAEAVEHCFSENEGEYEVVLEKCQEEICKEDMHCHEEVEVFASGSSESDHHDNEDGHHDEEETHDETTTEPAVKEFTMKAFRFGFEPNVLVVNKGDLVKITAQSVDVPHGLAIVGHDVNMRVGTKNPSTVEFTADKVGTFRIYCSVPCGSGHNMMDAQLVVEP